MISYAVFCLKKKEISIKIRHHCFERMYRDNIYVLPLPVIITQYGNEYVDEECLRSTTMRIEDVDVRSME